MAGRQCTAVALLLGAAQAFHHPHLYARSSVQALWTGLGIRRAASGGRHARLWASRRADTEGNHRSCEPGPGHGALGRGGVARRALVLGTSALGLVVLGAGPRVASAELEPVRPQSYLEQIEEAMPVKTIRGVWRIREYRDGQPLCLGRVTFRGFVDQPKGTVSYAGCNDSKGRGRWLLKPARIENGTIRFSARWKINFADSEDSLIYRGDVQPGGNFAKAEATITSGEILKPVKGLTGNLTEKRVGVFEADLVQRIDDDEKL